MSTPLAKPSAPSHSGVRSSPMNLRLVTWRDIVVLIDDGKAGPSDYATAEESVNKLAATFPGGLAFLTVIPASATPPSDDVRRAIKQAYESISRHLRCSCWFVDGRGFRGATVRAALAGLRLFVRPPYPTHITDDLEDAVRWSLTQLGPDRDGQLPDALFAIRRDRSLLGH